MRLIDANRLKAKITGITKPHEFVEEIDRRPTVESIPIEWFKNLIKTVEDSKNYEESEILKWALNKWENQEKANERETD